MKLPFQNGDPACSDFQYLEDLATSYWYAEVLFGALELRLFEYLAPEACDLETLARRAACHSTHLRRLLKVLQGLELVGFDRGKWFNSQVADRYLVPGYSSYLGDFLLYRRYMQPNWQKLVQKVALDRNESAERVTAERDYDGRTLGYVRALDGLAKMKAREVVPLVQGQHWQGPILDVGGGAGALSRALIRERAQGEVYLFDLPEVIRAARTLYPQAEAWRRFKTLEGDFRSFDFEGHPPFGLIILGNFLHAYGRKEARELLLKALELLKLDGLLLIHDYFPDRLGCSPHKGVLYDLNMLLNTYDGECHDSAQVVQWLQEAGLPQTEVQDLATDSTLILARRIPINQAGLDRWNTWQERARRTGFRRAVLLEPDQVATASWVRLKCRCGCKSYGQNLQCPPHGLEAAGTREVLQSYNRVLLLEGTPPGAAFHARLLKLEREAFLAGYPKALVFGAGPCPVCAECSEDGNCRHPEQARPAMEASGIDVYQTVKNAGLKLKPVTERGGYVKYFGLLLLE